MNYDSLIPARTRHRCFLSHDAIPRCRFIEEFLLLPLSLSLSLSGMKEETPGHPLHYSRCIKCNARGTSRKIFLELSVNP